MTAAAGSSKNHGEPFSDTSDSLFFSIINSLQPIYFCPSHPPWQILAKFGTREKISFCLALTAFPGLASPSLSDWSGERREREREREREEARASHVNELKAEHTTDLNCQARSLKCRRPWLRQLPWTRPAPECRTQVTGARTRAPGLTPRCRPTGRSRRRRTTMAGTF